MERRTFLSVLFKVVIIGSIASLPGCGRLLAWSRGGKEEPRDIRVVSEPKPQTPSVDTTKAPPASTYPELAVVRGKEPATNVRNALDTLGGIRRFVKPGDRVIVKPNILTARAPEYAATTNPAVVGAVVTLCFEAGAAEVVMLDNPTAPSRVAYETSGIAAATEQAGGTVKILSSRNFDTFAIPEGTVLTSWPLVSDIFEADVLINIPIAKTHSLAGLTLAMKNLMGIMGGSRGRIHADFHDKIVDLSTLVKPHLTLLDAHRMLIRNGPSGGSLSDVRVADTLVAGANGVSVDAYGATLFGKKPTDLSYLVKASERGLGEIDLSTLSISETTA